MLSPSLIVPVPVNRFHNKLSRKEPNNILRNPLFCTFASFLIFSLTPFINKSDSSSDLIIFYHYHSSSFISSLKIINVALADPYIFLQLTALIFHAASINYNSTKTLLANGLSTLPVKNNPIFSNGLKSLPKTPPDPLFYFMQ